MPMSLKKFREAQAAVRRGLPKLDRGWRDITQEIIKTIKVIRKCQKALKALRK